MDIKESTKLYKKKKEAIKKHRESYHQLDHSIISDENYDKLFNEYLKLAKKLGKNPEKDFPRPGEKPSGKFQKVTHKKPMLSLENILKPSVAEILEFEKKIKKLLPLDQKLKYFCEPKLDGLAVSLLYDEKGNLARALTRGDGSEGEDITENIKTIKRLPKKLKLSHGQKFIEIRGEVLILNKDFEKLNDQAKKRNEKIFTNPRNLAAGSVRQLDTEIADSRPLCFFAHSIGSFEGFNFKGQDDFLKQVEKFKIETVNTFMKKENLFKMCESPKEIFNHFKHIKDIRETLPFNIDGVVVKINSLAIRESLGNTARSPKWARALKFESQKAETKIKEIIIQVGRTGVLTPVARMEPIKVGGAMVAYATLHNQDEVHKKDIRSGDFIFIQRAGDVIPEVISVNLKKRDPSSKKFKMPSRCPSCKTKAVRIDGEVAFRCPNSEACPAQIRECFSHFVSRGAMNIESLAEKTIDLLLNKKKITHFSDLYKLKREDLLGLPSFKDKMASKIISSIDASREVDLDRFIFALGLRFLGVETSKVLTSHFQTIEALTEAPIEDILLLEGVGPKMAESIFKGLRTPRIKKEIQNLKKELKFKKINGSLKKDLPLSNQIFVITGTFREYSRSEAKKYVRQYGGSCKSSVSKNTNYVLAGDSPGASKINKARELGVTVISWKDFEELLV